MMNLSTSLLYIAEENFTLQKDTVYLQTNFLNIVAFNSEKKYLNDVLKMSIQTDDPDVGKITRS